MLELQGLHFTSLPTSGGATVGVMYFAFFLFLIYHKLAQIKINTQVIVTLVAFVLLLFIDSLFHPRCYVFDKE
jgi:hypothetical protein